MEHGRAPPQGKAKAPGKATAKKKGATAAGKADASARQARDQAQLPKHADTSRPQSAANSWQDLIREVSISPSPPRFGEGATVTFSLTQRAVKLRLGTKDFLLAVGGTASATARLSLSFPDPPKPHAWQCGRCRKEFTFDPSPCVQGQAPTFHDWECDRSGHNWKQEETTCDKGLEVSFCRYGGLHNWKCKRDSCGHKSLTDIISPSATSDGWMNAARSAFCDPGRAPEYHQWKCSRCDAQFGEGIREVICPRTPGSPPEVHGTFTGSVDLSVRLDDVAQRLFVSLNPAELVAWIPSVATFVAGGYQEALSGGVGRLTSGFPVEGPFRDSFDAACRAAATPLQTAFANGTRPLFEGLRAAVIAFAQQQLGAMNELFERIVEFLALVGDRRAVLDLATQLVATALHEANGGAIPKLWKLADHLLALCTQTLPNLAQTLTAKLLAATRDSFETHRTQIEVFLEDQLARIAQAGQDVLSFARGVLVGVRDAVNLQGSAQFLVGATLALVPGTVAAVHSDFPRILGTLFGVLVDAAEHDAGVVWEPLIDRLKNVHVLTGEEAKTMLSHLGDDTLLKRSLRWIREHWDRFKAMIGSGLDALKKWIDYLLDLVEHAGHPFAFPEHDRLVGMLKWLQGLPATMLAPDQFGDLAAHLNGFKTAMEGGLLEWLEAGAQAGRTTKGQFFKDFVTQNNLLMQSARRMQAAIAPILGQAPGQAQALSAEAVESALLAVHDLQNFEKRIWNVLFAGGAGEGPLTAQVSVNGLFSEPMQAQGGTIEVSEPTAFSDALQQGEQIIGSLGSSIAPDASFVSFDIKREKFRVPHPTNTRPITFSPGSSSPPIPLYLPVPWNAGVALCHLPEFYVLDMRYHFPYGDTGCYHTADLDNDGFVKPWEVRKVREAVTKAKTEDFYDFGLDCDGDGQITEHDLELAIEQQKNLVNGLMYRRATSPLGFFVALTPTVWGFVTFTDLTAESIPGGITRRGVMGVIDGQLAIPLPPGLFKDGQNYYPLRFHYENRFCVDKFDSLAPSLGGVSSPIAPLTATARWDILLRGGKTGRDWQCYFTSEPANPVLLTWNLMGTLYLRGVAAGGVGVGAAASVAAGGGGKGASYIHFAYETSAPLIEVIEEWADRFKGIAETKPSDLPAPWAFFKGILEWTDVPRLSRALIQIAGPLIDLLFDWCDEGHHIRGALGYVRQYVLNKWKPAPTWEQLRGEITHWDDCSFAERNAILTAVRSAQAKVMQERTVPANGGADGDEEPIYVPWLLARACREELAKLPPRDPAATAPDAAAARIKATFEDGRSRFAASLDQLVPDGGSEKTPYAGSATIPLCGRFEVLNPFIASFPVRWQDLKDNAHPSEATLDQILAVRGNPFYKPIYHTVVELGPEAKLFTCPNRDLNYFIASAANQKGIVEGSRLLEDKDGNRWMWIRTDSWHHGWVFIDSVVCKELFSVKEAAEVAGKQAGQDIASDLLNEVLGTAGAAGLPVSVLGGDAVDKINRGMGDLLDKLARKGARPTVIKIEASPPSTVDESRYARVCRQALARRTAGRRLPGDEHIYRCYADALGELDMRMHGAHAPDLSEAFTPPAQNVLEEMGVRLATSFNKLSMTKREKLWAAGTAWLKLLEYSPMITEVFIEALIPPIMEGDFDKAWNNFLTMLRKTTNVQLEDLLIAVQTCAPGVKEVILTMIDIGIKLKSIKDSITNKEANIAGSGEVGTPGDGKSVSWKDVGIKIVRLLIDDEEEPGRPAATQKKEQRGLKKNHDHAIGFSFEASVKVTEEPAAGQAAAPKKVTRERIIALAEPYIVRIEQRNTNAEEGAGGASEAAASDAIGDGLVDEEPPPETTDSRGGGAPIPGEEVEADTQFPAIVGKPIELQITEWGALVFTDPATAEFVDATRIPQAYKDTVGWQVSISDEEDETPAPFEDLPDQHGEHMRFDVTGLHEGKVLRFRAFTRKFDWKAVVDAAAAAAAAETPERPQP